jgi:hypothetical protein
MAESISFLLGQQREVTAIRVRYSPGYSSVDTERKTAHSIWARKQLIAVRIGYSRLHTGQHTAYSIQTKLQLTRYRHGYSTLYIVQDKAH